MRKLSRFSAVVAHPAMRDLYSGQSLQTPDVTKVSVRNAIHLEEIRESPRRDAALSRVNFYFFLVLPLVYERFPCSELSEARLYGIWKPFRINVRRDSWGFRVGC